MLKMVEKKKKVEVFEHQILRDVIMNKEGGNMANSFEGKI